jgi:hypothetical protein
MSAEIWVTACDGTANSFSHPYNSIRNDGYLYENDLGFMEMYRVCK